MADVDRDTPLRLTAFEHVRRLSETHDHLTATELKPGFVFEGERVPLINPQRGIFKPLQMRFLLSIKTVFPFREARRPSTLPAHNREHTSMAANHLGALRAAGAFAAPSAGGAAGAPRADTHAVGCAAFGGHSH